MDSALNELVAGLFDRPDLYPGRISDEGTALDFALIPELLHRSVQGYLADSYRISMESLLTLYERRKVQGKPPRYVFNTGYCGSTFIARCLDAMGGCISVKEPRALDQWAAARADWAARGELQHWDRILDLLVSLLFRTSGPDRSAVVKSGDSTNLIMTDLFRMRHDSSALFLYSDLEAFLCACLKSVQRRAEFQGLVRMRLARLGAAALGVDADAIESLSDARAIATIWCNEIRLYCALADQEKGTRVRSLNFDVFLRDPRLGLAALRDLFDLPCPDEELRAIAQGPIFEHHSKHEGKEARSFSPRARMRTQQDLRLLFRHELEEGLRWGEALCKAMPPTRLPLDLLDHAAPTPPPAKRNAVALA